MDVFPSTISLYSFKGGAGRTVCSLNLAGVYATEIGASTEKPILLIDMDLDSAGLTMLLQADDRFRASPWSSARLVTGDIPMTIIGTADKMFNDGLVDVSEKVGAPTGSVLFMGTEVIGREDSTIVGGAAYMHIEQLKYECAQRSISTILIDSASGRQEVAHLCHRVSDIIIYCCRLTGQFLLGTRKQIEHFTRECIESGMSIPGLMLLPMAVPDPIVEPWIGQKENAFVTLRGMLAKLSRDTEVDIDLIEPGIGEVESFKWIESALLAKPQEKLADDEKTAVQALRNLALSIASHCNRN